ncbi:hypothetical protein QBC45DRAFT_476503 [Copromyces sp. CBS 386.78]|nr:hypothetical protein QBC45DRAFT_476503 [Copromyces sp. CBS 386.78]
MPNPSSVWTNSRPDSQTHNHRIKHSADSYGSLRIGRTLGGCPDEDGNPEPAAMATTARKARTYWMGAEPLNGLYGLRAFSLLNLGPHSETTGARTRSSAPGLLLAFTGAAHVVGDTREHSGLQDRWSRSTRKLRSRYPCCGSLCGTLTQAAACSSPELE